VVEKPINLNEWEYGGLNGIAADFNQRTSGNTSRVPMIDPWVSSKRRKGGTGQEPCKRYYMQETHEGEKGREGKQGR
jgi:hypothetical protein